MSLVNTRTQSLRTRYDKAIDKHERRRSRYGGLDLFQRQTNGPRTIATPAVKEVVARSEGHAIQVPVLNAREVTLSNVRSCNVVDSENDSAFTTLTFMTLAFGFTMTPARHANNEIKYQADFDTKMEEYLLKVASTLDNLCISKLNAVKNQVWATEATNVYAQVGNALQVPQSEAFDMYNQMDAIMEYMDFYGDLDILANTMHKTQVSRLMAQGAGNDVNDAFQFGGYNFGYSNRVTNRTGVHSTAYVVPQGSVAILNRNDWDAVNGSSIGTQKIWGTTYLPLINQTWGTFYTEDCSDRSALHEGTEHLTRTKLESYEFSTDIVLMSTYNSNPATRYSPVVKAEVWAGDSAPV